MITAQKSKNFGRLTINGEEYDVYLAKTEEQKKRGYKEYWIWTLMKECYFL